MAELQTHPTFEELEAFSLGRIAPPAATEIEEHVTQCDKCCETLLGFSASDTFIGLLIDADRIADGSTINLDSRNADRSEQPEFRAADSADHDIPVELSENSRYRVLGLIGSGGMGEVYKAEHRLMQRTVALKVINRRLIDRPEAVDRFHREVRAAARLHHPNIVAAYDAEQAGSIHFLAMEFVDGTELSQVVKDRGPLPVAEAVDYTLQTLCGLEHAHEMGMVHRDIKPQNLMLDGSGNIKILDFGLAHFACESAAGVEGEEGDSADGPHLQQHLTQLGTMMGTPDYVAPEQAIDARSADIRSDIYSLGCTLYFLLTGRPPFAEASGIEKLRAHSQRDPESVTITRDDIPGALDNVLRRMMSKDPATRYQAPSEAAAALRPFADVAVVNRDAQPLTGGSGRRSSPKRWFMAAAFLPFVAAAGVLLYLASDTGHIEVRSDATIPGAKVVLAKGGKEYATFNLQPGITTQRIRAGQYDVSLRGTSPEVNMSVWSKPARSNDWGEHDPYDSEPVVLYRGGGLLIDVRKRRLKAAIPVRSTGGATNFEAVQTGAFTEIARLDHHSDHITCLTFSPDGKFLYSAGGEKLLYQWNYEAGSVVRMIPLGGLPQDLQVLPNGKQILTSYFDGSITLWSLADGRAVRRFVGHSKTVEAIAVSPDGQRLLSGGFDGLVRLWDLESGDEILSFSDDFCGAVALSSDGRLAANGASDGIRIWETASGKSLRKIKRHTAAISAAAFTPDGRRLVTGDGNGRIQVWDVLSGDEVYHLEAHKDSVRSLVITPDGRFIISGSFDKWLRIFDLSYGTEVAGQECENLHAVYLAISPDGRMLASGGGSRFYLEDNEWKVDKDGDYGIRLWRLAAPLSAVGAEMSQKLASFIRATKEASTDDEWKSALDQHAPVWAEFDPVDARALLGLLSKLPDTAHQKLMQEGYLKWSFDSLDATRQASLQTFMKHLLAPTAEMGFPPATAEMGPTLLKGADVGFAVISPPESSGQILFWYLLKPGSPLPVSFPVVMVGIDENEDDVLTDRWLADRLFELVDQPYSDTPPVAAE